MVPLVRVGRRRPGPLSPRVSRGRRRRHGRALLRRGVAQPRRRPRQPRPAPGRRRRMAGFAHFFDNAVAGRCTTCWRLDRSAGRSSTSASDAQHTRRSRTPVTARSRRCWAGRRAPRVQSRQSSGDLCGQSQSRTTRSVASRPPVASSASASGRAVGALAPAAVVDAIEHSHRCRRSPDRRTGQRRRRRRCRWGGHRRPRDPTEELLAVWAPGRRRRHGHGRERHTRPALLPSGVNGTGCQRRLRSQGQ